MEQLERIAEAGGRRLQLRTIGPFYRITCSSNGESVRNAQRHFSWQPQGLAAITSPGRVCARHELGIRTTSRRAGAQPKPLGVSNGFLLPPLRLMHCDTLEVFAHRPGGPASAEERRQAEGVGLLLRTAVFAHGHACGCTKAEILAINDDGERSPCTI